LVIFSSSTPSTLSVADRLFDGQKNDERHHPFMTDTQPAVGNVIISHPRRNDFSGHLPADISDPEDDYEETPLSLKEIERKKIDDALKRSRGKRKKAATELGISERTLYRKIKEYNLNMDEE
jgi:DNA-binding NtrC family response regulator